MRETAGYDRAAGWTQLALQAALGCALLACRSPAHAQTAGPTIQAKTVPAGEKRQLAFLTALNPDCSVNAETAVRILKQAGHGAAEIDRGPGYTSYRRWDLRYMCNLAPREGYQVQYAPAADFKGDDELEIEFFGPAGYYAVTRYAITVK